MSIEMSPAVATVTVSSASVTGTYEVESDGWMLTSVSSSDGQSSHHSLDKITHVIPDKSTVSVTNREPITIITGVSAIVTKDIDSVKESNQSGKEDVTSIEDASLP